MARTEQTASRRDPTASEVSAALVVASVTMNHTLAPSLPALSAARTRGLVEWIGRAYGGDVFMRPVDWEGLGLMDYPEKVPHPMDLTAICRYCDSDAFEFAGAQDMLRLVWANACRYNPEGSPVNTLARRLGALAEEAVIDAQEHPDDDDPGRVSLVYLPVVSTLSQSAVFEPFVSPIDPLMAPGYEEVVIRPISLDEIVDGLEREAYHSRYDVERDGAAKIVSSSPSSPRLRSLPPLTSHVRLCLRVPRRAQSSSCRATPPPSIRRRTPTTHSPASSRPPRRA